MKWRRHHNNDGREQIRQGKTRTQIEEIADKLQLPIRIGRNIIPWKGTQVMDTFKLPSKDKLPALIALNRSIKRGDDLPADFNEQISELLDLEHGAAWDGLVGAFALRDIVFAGEDYLNIDIREYYRGTDKGYFLIKLENEAMESDGNHHTLEGALIDAILRDIVFRLQDDYED